MTSGKLGRGEQPQKPKDNRIERSLSVEQLRDLYDKHEHIQALIDHMVGLKRHRGAEAYDSKDSERFLVTLNQALDRLSETQMALKMVKLSVSKEELQTLIEILKKNEESN